MAYETKYESRKAALEWVKEVLLYNHLEPTTDYLRGFNAGIAHAVDVVDEKLKMDERSKDFFDE